MCLSSAPILSIKGDSSSASEVKYHYVSDTERWFYEKEAYEYPYYTWAPQYYWNGTAYNLLYFPYYTTAYSYRNVKVYEYYLTVKSSISGAVVTGSGWYRQGSSAAISASTEVEGGSDVRYMFSGWSGDYSGGASSATVTMDKAKTFTANYRARYRLTARSSPADVLGAIEENWYDEGAEKTLPAAPEVVKADPGKRYVFDSWYVDGARTVGNPISLPIDKPHLAEARYKTQYYLNVESLYGYPQGAGWYDGDARATFEVSTPVEADFGRKWVFEQWRGDAATATSQGTIIMDGPKTVTAVWKLDSTVLYTVYGLIISAVVAAVVVLALVAVRYSGAQPVQFCQRCGYRLAKDFNLCPICGSPKPGAGQQTAPQGRQS